jgi:CBS domain-containing protein
MKEKAMKVKDIMSTDLKACTPDTTVAEAAHLMWDGDCGILPVVDEGVLVGVVTDRDMYIALATQNARASQVRVGAVASTKLATCAPEDDVRVALATMKEARVRRLPVVGFGGTVTGILSMNDILRGVASGKKGVATDLIIETLQAICAHHHPAPHVVAA